ncbi:MAG: hypothetical protein E7287_00325 [Lachnospiraceae bacterium]|nr:hypothetical protein [Lachnospiraceae bacterium]
MKRKNKQAIWIGIIMFVIAIVSFVYWSRQKQVWFCDEVYTYESSNGFEQPWPATYTAQWMSGEDVERYLAADSDNLSFQTISANLYSDHVPLYFWIFRLVSFFFFHGSGSIWIGFVINLVFYLVFVGVLYKVLLHLTDSASVSGVIVLLSAVANRLMLEQIMTLRMYMMLLLGEGLLLLAGFLILRDLERKKMRPGAFVFLYLISVFGLLTHYHYWVFYAATAFVFCMWMLLCAWRKEKKKFLKTLEIRSVIAWVGNFIASLLTTILLFPYCRWNLNRGKGEMALSAVFDFSAKKIKDILWGYERLSAVIFGDGFPAILGLVIIFGFSIAGGILLYKKKDYGRFTCLVITVAISQLYQLVVCFTLPAGGEERYLWGPFTFLTVCMLWGAALVLKTVFSGVKADKPRCMGLRVAATVLTVAMLMNQWLIVDGGNGIAYLFQQGKDVTLLEEHRELPWLVDGAAVDASCYFDWLIPEQICFVSGEKSEADAQAVQVLKDKEAFVLYAVPDLADDMIAFLEETLGRELSCEKLTQSTKMLVYVVKKAE